MSMYITTPISVSKSGPKKAKNCTLAIQTLGATDLMHSIYTQIDFVSNKGEIPPCYTTSHWYVKRKSDKKENFLKKIGPK